MPIEWKFKKEKVFWKDGSHWLSRHFEAITTANEMRCKYCKSRFYDGNQAYMVDETGAIQRKKKIVRDISSIRGKRMIIHNAYLVCHNCMDDKTIYPVVQIKSK